MMNDYIYYVILSHKNQINIFCEEKTLKLEVLPGFG